jgi:hypothetical protein
MPIGQQQYFRLVGHKPFQQNLLNTPAQTCVII